MDRYRSAVRQRQWKAEQDQRDRAYRTNLYVELAKEGVTEGTGTIVGALERGDMDAVDKLMKGNKPLSVRLNEARITAANTQVQADLAKIRKLNFETYVEAQSFLREEAQRSLLDIAGISDSSKQSVGGTEVGGMKLGEMHRLLDNDILDKDGKVKSGREGGATAIRDEMFKRGLVVVFEAPDREGIWGSIAPGSRTLYVPLSRVLNDLKALSRNDAAAQKRLLDSGLFKMSGDTVVPAGETSYGDLNAQTANAISAVFLHQLEVKEKADQELDNVPEPVLGPPPEETPPEVVELPKEAEPPKVEPEVVRRAKERVRRAWEYPGLLRR
jgi:hypothetical protein